MSSGDCKAAFLQGVKFGDLPKGEGLVKLYMSAPKDPISKEAVEEFLDPDGTPSLWELLGPVFGLADAPRRWFEDVRRRLLEATSDRWKWVQHSLDAAVF